MSFGFIFFPCQFLLFSSVLLCEQASRIGFPISTSLHIARSYASSLRLVNPSCYSYLMLNPVFVVLLSPLDRRWHLHKDLANHNCNQGLPPNTAYIPITPRALRTKILAPRTINSSKYPQTGHIRLLFMKSTTYLVNTGRRTRRVISFTLAPKYQYFR
ncbi:hypothetical protein BJX65DRAFT_51833 [Aspergillus insuetus]